MQREYKLQLSLLIVMVLTISSATKGQQQQLKQQQLTAGAGKGTLLKCVIKCGILEELRGSTNLMSVVTELNDNLRRSDQISSAIELQLLNTKTSSNVSMDALLQAYTSIGSLNVTALLGSYSLSVELIAHKFNIPFFITSSFYAKHQHHLQKSHSSMTSSNHVLTVFPSPEQLYHVTTDLIRRLEWTSVAVLYDEIMQGVILLEDLVREPSVFVRAWKCSVDMENDTLRDALLDVRKMDITSLVVMTTRSLNNRILEKALRLSMLSYEYSWILPLLDQDDALIEAYANTGVSLYTMRLAHRSQQYYHAPSQHSSDNVRDTAEGYVGLDHVTGRRPTAAMWTKFERATIEDSLLTIYHVTRLQYRTTGKCNSWTSLDEMLSLLSSIDAEGTTGKLHYDQTGRRHGFTVNLFRLRPTGFYQVGMWNSSINERQARLQIFDDVIDPVKEAESDGTVNVRNEVLQIVAVMVCCFLSVVMIESSVFR